MPFPQQTSAIDPDHPLSEAASAASGKQGSARSRFAAPQAVRPTPLPKRPKGKWFVGLLLLSMLAVPIYLTWDTFFRYQAYGVVTGRTIRISPSWGGTIHALHVQEGEAVRQGQLLVTLTNVDLEQRLARIGDDVRIAQATLESEMSQLQWQTQAHGDRDQKALAEYYELWGTLREEESKLAEIELRRQRNETLRQKGIITREAWDAIVIAESGAREKVDKLRSAVEELKKRTELNDSNDDDAHGQLKPLIVKIETLQAEMERLRQLLKQGEIRAPVDGRVVKRNLFPGESAQASQTIMEILEDGSLQIVLYVSQSQADQFGPGQTLNVNIEPNADTQSCSIVRTGESLEPAPPGIARFYSRNEKLVAIYLQAPTGEEASAPLRLASKVKLPYTWTRLVARLPH